MSTQPTIHDSDRKAGKEIANRVSQANSTYYGVPSLSKSVEEETALYMTEIIARHHAEERAAVEKVREALEAAQVALSSCETCSGITGNFMRYNNDKVYASLVSIKSALTALRTASQSPTEGKT